MKKLIVVLTVVVFVANFVVPALAATPPPTGTHKATKPGMTSTTAKPGMTSGKAMKPGMTSATKSTKAMHPSAKKMVAKKKMAKACAMKRRHHHKKMAMAAKRAKGPSSMRRTHYVRKGGYLYKCVRKGAGPKKHHKHYRKSGKVCPAMPGQTY